MLGTCSDLGCNPDASKCDLRTSAAIFEQAAEDCVGRTLCDDSMCPGYRGAGRSVLLRSDDAQADGRAVSMALQLRSLRFQPGDLASWIVLQPQV